MSQGPPTRPARKSSEAPRVRFSWPPTDDELAQYGREDPRSDTESEEAALEASEPRAEDASPAADTIGLFPSETLAAPLPALPREAPPVDGARGASDGGDFEQSWSDATSTSGIAVSPGATVVDPPVRGDLADEIANLQTLIEGLTQELEWRRPSVTGR